MGFLSIFPKRINLVTCKVPIRSPLKQRICDWVHRRAILDHVFHFAWDQGVYLKMLRTRKSHGSGPRVPHQNCNFEISIRFWKQPKYSKRGKIEKQRLTPSY